MPVRKGLDQLPILWPLRRCAESAHTPRESDGLGTLNMNIGSVEANAGPSEASVE